MKRSFLALFSIFLSSLPFDLYAQRREGDLAVLEFTRGKNLPAEINTEFLRGVVMEEATKLTNYRVMTRENVFAILRDKNIDLSKCTDIECAVDYGRVLQADKLVVGSLDYIQGIYYLKLVLYDTPSASIDNSITRKCEGCNFDDLVKLVRSCAMELLAGISGRRWFERELGKKPEGWEIKEEEDVIVYFESEPKGAMVEVGGKPLCNTPCSRLLKEGGYRISFKLPKHLTEERDIIVKKGIPPVKVKLTPDIGYLTIQSEPDGIDVVINRERIGKTPVNRYEIEPGRYEVVLRDPRFYESGKVIEIARGEEKVISFKLTPREGGIKVRAYDDKGNAIEADVYLDGKKIGRAPGTFKVIIGEHRLRIEKGDLSYEKKISVEEKKVVEVEAFLKKVEKKPLGIFIYPAINYSFSSPGGLAYGGGLGYKISLPFLLSFGMEWTYGKLSDNGREITQNLFKFYPMLGVDFLRRSRFGLYTKPSFNIEHLSGFGHSETSPVFRIEFGFHSFIRPIHIFSGFFLDSDLMGISFCIGGYF